ncbi:MAG: T9SS type A sorting domain-containing protein [Siphonobacter sp.]
MKKVLLLACVLMAGIATAQKKEDAKLRLHYEYQNGAKNQILDRTFNNQAQLDTFLDSLNAAKPAGGHTSITIGDEDDVVFDHRRAPKDGNRETKIYRFRKNEQPMARGDWEQFGQNMERFGKDVERWGKDFGDKFDKEYGPKMKEMAKQINKKFDFQLDGKALPPAAPQVWSFDGPNGSKTVKSLNAYPNRPFNHTLNIRFVAPAKGDVTITVTDVKGHELAKETVKDFEGEYIGQVSLSKKAEKGTLFVTVTQGEDGTVKRVVVE